MNFVQAPTHKLFDTVTLKNLIVSSVVLLMLVPYLASCATSGGSRIHAMFVPSGSQRLAQVVDSATREQILSWKEIVLSLEASGITKADIQDRSLAMGRVECCGGPEETSTAIFFYVPKEMKVEVGDIVEIRSGGDFKFGEVGSPVNVLTRVSERYSDAEKQCNWDPPNNLFWKRILYCNWMQQEGWVLEKHAFGLKYWIKRSS